MYRVEDRATSLLFYKVASVERILILVRHLAAIDILLFVLFDESRAESAVVPEADGPVEMRMYDQHQRQDFCFERNVEHGFPIADGN